MNVLVTGAAGFVGSRLVPLLRDSGHTVRALVRTPQTLPGVETSIGTLPDASLCQKLCANLDAVIHLAAIAHVNADTAALKAQNFDATVELATAARAQGVRKFIFVSSCKARYPAHSAYARYKAEAETALRKLHEPGRFAVVCLRPASVYGRGMQGNLRGLLRMLSRPSLPAFVTSSTPLGLVSVQDLCRAILAALATEELPDQIWELADGHAYTLDELVRYVRSSSGLPQPALAVPRTLFWLVAALAELAAPVLRSSLSLSTYRTLYAEAYNPDSQFSLRTGFTPQDSLYSRLPELLEDINDESASRK